MNKHVLILLENEAYPWDMRVRRAATTLTDAGFTVSVIGPTREGYEALRETVAGVEVLRYRSPPGGQGALGYVREYGVSLTLIWRLSRQVHGRRAVDLVVGCNPPDMLPQLGRGLSRPRPAVIFDQHDLSPELFERKFGQKGPLHRLLLRVEQSAYRAADVVMVPNDSYAEVGRRRGGVHPDNLFVVRNAPDPARIFPVEPRSELRRGKRSLVVWTGSMTQPERCVRLIEAAEEIGRRGRDDIGFALVGRGDARSVLEEDVRRRGLMETVDLPGVADDELLREYLATADVCVSVDEQNEMNDRSTVTKVLDYMAMGRPVLQFPLKEMQRVCGDASAYARNGDSHDLAEQILALVDDPERRERMGRKARERMLAGQMWPDQVPALLAAVERALVLRGGEGA